MFLWIDDPLKHVHKLGQGKLTVPNNAEVIQNKVFMGLIVGIKVAGERRRSGHCCGENC
jgi:hypothetical protein